MFGQTFTPSDLAIVAFLVILEGLLSADNALVLAVMVKHLPPDQQKRALFYGLGGSFVFRLVAIVLATYLIRLWWLQALGAAYLLYLPIKHFAHRNKQAVEVTPQPMWKTVLAVELTDISFALDSVLAGIAVIRGAQEKVWVVYLGAMMGILLLRFAAGLIIRLLERAPVLDHFAYLLVAWVGVKLAFLATHNWSRVSSASGALISEMPAFVFWPVLAGICCVAAVVAARSARRHGEREG
jgi:YkoY family integral membrane protein